MGSHLDSYVHTGIMGLCVRILADVAAIFVQKYGRSPFTSIHTSIQFSSKSIRFPSTLIYLPNPYRMCFINSILRLDEFFCDAIYSVTRISKIPANLAGTNTLRNSTYDPASSAPSPRSSAPSLFHQASRSWPSGTEPRTSLVSSPPSRSPSNSP